MPRPKQHHYVTKAYLDGFLKPNQHQLVCYGRRRSACFLKSPDELGKQRNFYAIRGEDGTWDDSLEHLLERTVERPGLPVIRKLAAGSTRLNWEERQALSLLVAFQETRTPAARAHTRAMLKMLSDRIVQDVREADPNQSTVGLLGTSGVTGEVTLEEIESSYKDLCDDHSETRHIHRLLADNALTLHKLYMQMKFTVLYATGDGEFLTTDHPVVKVFRRGPRQAGAGMNRSDVELRFPLSRTAFLTITHDGPRMETLMKAGDSKNKRARALVNLPEVRVRHIATSEIRALNRGQVRHAQQWVFAPQEVDWVEPLLKQNSEEPVMTDRSNSDLLHFRSEVRYDPAIDTTG